MMTMETLRLLAQSSPRILARQCRVWHMQVIMHEGWRGRFGWRGMDGGPVYRHASGAVQQYLPKEHQQQESPEFPRYY